LWIIGVFPQPVKLIEEGAVTETWIKLASRRLVMLDDRFG
jgi:hypothetical protein